MQFAESKGRIYCLDGIHPSLKLTAGNTFSGSASFIIEQVNQSNIPCTIVLESVDPLTGRVSNCDWLLQINRPVRIIVDDSHGIGVLGEKGTGIHSYLPQSDCLHYLICYSLSKAFSCEGGAVSGETGDILEIKAKAPFSAATPMSPIFVHAWMESRSCFEKQLNKLKQNSHYFADKIKDLPIQYDEQLPVCRLDNENLYGEALRYHIILSAFRYPTVKDPLMTRVILNALHMEEDIDQLVNCIRHLSF